MTLCMSIHFAGHEFLRSPTSAMFTSKEIGSESSAALPFAVGYVSPFSGIVLWVSLPMYDLKMNSMYVLIFEDLS